MAGPRGIDGFALRDLTKPTSRHLSRGITYVMLRNMTTTETQPLSRRERARLATLEEIKSTALDLMREQGSVDIKFTDIARVMGMTAPALYRYYGDRNELLTALIVDGFENLGASVAEALRPIAPDDVRGRWLAAATAYRNWARSDPQQFGLVLGMPL